MAPSSITLRILEWTKDTPDSREDSCEPQKIDILTSKQCSQCCDEVLDCVIKKHTGKFSFYNAIVMRIELLDEENECMWSVQKGEVWETGL